MTLRDCDRIHALSVDFAFCADAPESVELADWVKDELLPVIEEVFDRRQAPGRRRIERLEIDLGTVSEQEARSELPRRLFAQLAAALEEVLDDAGLAAHADGGAQGQGSAMLEFLRHGTIPWTAAGDGAAGHIELLHQVIASPEAREVLGEALRDAHMLTRLIRQYDVAQLLAAAQALMAPWPQAERAAALAWAGAELGRLPRAGAQAEAFWRWFLPHSGAQPASPDLMEVGWREAGQAALTVLGSSSADAMRAIEHGLESGDFSVLAPHWDYVLASAPQTLRQASANQRARWLERFDADTLADILAVLQPDCAWLIGRIATVVPRASLNAALQPAMTRWLAEPVDSLAPDAVLEWVRAALPAHAAPIGALFASAPGQGVRPELARAPAAASTTFTAAETRIIEHGLEVADFALLAPYWERILASAPRRLREAHPRLWRQWLDRFDDATLTDIVAVVQADCAWLIETLATIMPRSRLNALLRPAMREWMAVPADGLAPHAVLKWVAASVADESSGALAPDTDASVRQDHDPVAGGATPLRSDAQMLLAADGLFRSWPQAQREVALAWAGEQTRGLREADTDSVAFWRWFLPKCGSPAGLDVLAQEWSGKRRAAPPASPQSPPNRALAELLTLQHGGLTPDETSRAYERLCTALAAPERLAQLVGQLDARQRVAAARVMFRTWPPAQCEAVLAWAEDEQRRLQDGGEDAASFWRWLLAQHACQDGPDALIRSYAVEREQDAQAVPGGRERQAAARTAMLEGAIDSKHFREPLRVLEPLFERTEIITISKGLNAADFALLAPYWDRLLVLAPHWLRSEYPRLARTWLAGFDAEVLIDILSVVQAPCCVLVEQLASALPREQLHAALQPSLAHWFERGVDRLAPQAVIDAVRGAIPAMPAALAAQLCAPAAETALGADPQELEQALRAGDMARLRRSWSSLLMAQRAPLRRAWAGLSAREREHAFGCMAAQLPLEQQLDVAMIVQPAAALLAGELHRFLDEHNGAPIFHSALDYLLHAEVASVVPVQLMRHVLDRHGALTPGLPLDAARHIAAALQACGRAPVQFQATEGEAALASARRSQEALCAYVAGRQRDDPQFGQLNAAQLHALVQAWAGLAQPGEGGGAFLAAVEAQALRSGAPHAFFGKVLQHATRGESLDLDAIEADCGTSTRSPVQASRGATHQGGAEPEAVTAHDTVSPLSGLLCRALPQRLADAMLRADLSPLDALWPAIVAHHPALLRQAAQRYLVRPEARTRLIASTATGTMRDLLGCVSAWSVQLAAPLLDSAGRFGMTLPAALAPAAFAQRVLAHAFAQALDGPGEGDAAAWISGLLRAVLAPPSRQSEAGISVMAHAWYEVLRGGGTLLETAFEHLLFGSACLEPTLKRLQPDARHGHETPLPDGLQSMLTIQMCTSYPALTDQLLADGHLANADAAVFSVAEWQALAMAQLPRQEHAAQVAFWREHAAHLPTPDAAMDEEAGQAAFAAAFAILKPPARQGAAAATVAAATVAASPGAVMPGAGADAIAVLLMREREPDDAARASITVLTQRLLAGEGIGSQQAALRSALAHPRALGRLLEVLPGPTLARLLCVLQPSLASALPAVLRSIGGALPVPIPAVPATLESPIWRAIYEAVFAGAAPAGADALLRALTGRLALDGDVSRPIDAQPLAAVPAHAVTPAQAMALLLQPLAGPPPAQAVARARYVDDAAAPFTGDANLRNAGLVIVAAYVERLFAMLGVTEDGKFVSDEARQRGVHLLQYVVSAEESTPEYLLALNKLLCGIPAAVPVVAGISMSEKEKSVIDQMLKGVIANWSAIGASTVAGLRETFLQREGCLYYQDEAWHLNVPQGTFDMLLDRLPWGYKTIQFSWMTARLNVVWR